MTPELVLKSSFFKKKKRGNVKQCPISKNQICQSLFDPFLLKSIKLFQ